MDEYIERNRTVIDQTKLESEINILKELFIKQTTSEQNQHLALKKELHIQYLKKHINKLPDGFLSLDASRPWIIYWILHSLSLFNTSIESSNEITNIINFLKSCHIKNSGFSGGPGQLPHLLTTYAAVMSLIILGNKEALNIIDREGIYSFFMEMCVDSEQGGMTVHKGGEVDMRGCYTALAVCHVLGLDKFALAEKANIITYIKSCQSYEGGLGGEPGNEAHGGYTFCGVAALCLLDKLEELDIPKLIRWLVQVQGSVEGGFMGRTHKLVDGCYSFWQAGVFMLLQNVLKEFGDEDNLLNKNILKSISNEIDITILNKIEIHNQVSHADQIKNREMKRLNLIADKYDIKDKTIINQLLNEAINPNDDSDSNSDEEELDLNYELFKKQVEQSKIQIQSTELAIYKLIKKEHINKIKEINYPILYDVTSLQAWILICCQNNISGGFRDQPDSTVDLYHTCYCLSGLAISQAYSGLVLGPIESNLLCELDPLINVTSNKLNDAMNYFK